MGTCALAEGIVHCDGGPTRGEASVKHELIFKFTHHTPHILMILDEQYTEPTQVAMSMMSKVLSKSQYL